MVDGAYLKSLARGAPNLEELEIHALCELSIVRDIFRMVSLSSPEPFLQVSALSMYPNLKRLYLFPDDHLSEMFWGSTLSKIYSGSTLYPDIAMGCPNLESITQTVPRSGIYGSTPYSCMKIQRESDGTIILTKGFGYNRVIGWEDVDLPLLF